MKIRFGFVSNSSSSSFVIALEVPPKNLKNLRFMLWMFDDHIINKCSETKIESNKAARRILKDIRKSVPITKWKDIYNIMLRGHLYSDLMPVSDDFKSWDEYHKRYKETSKIVAKTFMRNNRKRNVYVLEYGDNKTSLESCLEHGGIFDNIKHLHISHH